MIFQYRKKLANQTAQFYGFRSGFAISGDGSVNSHQLIEDVKDDLPSERLKTEEYSRKILDAYNSNPNKYKHGHNDFDESLRNNIYIAGYDLGFNGSFAYHVILPHNPPPETLRSNQNGIFISGTGDHIDSAEKAFISIWTEGILNKIKGIQMLGGSLPPILSMKMSSLRSGKIPFAIMDKLEMIDFAKFVIEFTNSEQIRLNEIPTVGRQIDMIFISPKKGVEVLQYERLYGIGEIDLANTDHHFALLRCCSQDVKLQMNLSNNDRPIKSYVPYPKDEIFRCKTCKKEYALAELKSLYEKLGSKWKED